ncbi:hypothetical protein [Haloferula sp.]|uniref:hypothetical protein n=1 Tax=Haloferula sp. TaxID=2497595 RepID=UPI00329D2826
MADPNWFPAPFDFNANEASAYTLALDGDGLFVGGAFTSISGFAQGQRRSTRTPERLAGKIRPFARFYEKGPSP